MIEFELIVFTFGIISRFIKIMWDLRDGIQSVYNVRKREVKKWKNIKHGQKKAHRDRFISIGILPDETLKDEFETYVGNVGEQTIRLSDHEKDLR